MLFTLLLVLQTIIAIALITVILMQRSEGGGLVSGGSPSGLMTARGAADFLTRATSILAGLFIILSIALAGVAAGQRGPRTIDPSLAATPPAGAPVQRQNSPFDVIPGATGPAAGAPVNGVAPTVPANQSGGVPIAQ